MATDKTNQMRDRASTSAPTDRRNFLKFAGASAIGGGAALVAGQSPADAATAVEPSKTGLYRETAHVRRYYELAKF